MPTAAGPQPVEIVLGARRSLARSRRYAQISRILVRHGLGPYLQGRPLRGWETAEGRAVIAVSLRRALEEGGVTFVKFGQLLSTRRDLLPEEFTDELSPLQDRAEPAPWEQVEAVEEASDLVAVPGAAGNQNVGNIGLVVHDQQTGEWLMSVTQIDIDDDALERAMALSGSKTKKEAVNLALQFYAEKQERAARIARHFERARHWGALEDAERLHRAEKETR